MTLEQMRHSPPGTVTYVDFDQTPDHGTLVSEAEEFYRSKGKKEYARMVKSGELKEACELKAKQTEDYANSLMNTGTNPGQAWIQARRTIIAELETSD